jgi:hypothetical protein
VTGGFYSSTVPDASAVVTVTFPTPANPVYSGVKTVQGSQASPGDLLLFAINYDYVNTQGNSFVVTDSVPANTTLVDAGPGAYTSGGTAAGSGVTWTLPASSANVRARCGCWCG